MNLPHDLSGSMAKNRFKNELLWGVHKILELYKVKKEYYIVFDYVCDIELHFKENKFEFYQIKTHSSGESYTFQQITNPGKKENSVLGTLYKIKHKSDEPQKIILAIVSNKPFKDCKNHLYTEKEIINFNELDEENKNKIKALLQKELKVDKEINLENIFFIKSTIDLINPKNAIIGEIATLFEERNIEIRKPNILYKMLIDEISKKAEYELEVNNYDELLEKKGIGNKYIEDLFSKFIEFDNDIVKNVSIKIEKIYENNIRKKFDMKKAIAKVLQYLNNSKEIENKEKEIFNFIQENIEILENCEEKVIDIVLEKFEKSFSTIYTEEEKRVLIMIILEKYEEGLYNE
jgi:hypothetical protein